MGKTDKKVSIIKAFSYDESMLNIAEINLSTLKSNALAVKEKLNKGVKFCAVVKANAYGHGGVEIANALYSIVDCYAVALVEEGVELRRAGIDKDILVLTPIFERDVELAVEYSLTLTVESKAQILSVDKESTRQGRKSKIHVKYNTGMNRFGVDGLEQLERLIVYASGKKGVILEGMYSHLACPQNKKGLKTVQNKFLLANNLVKRYNNKAVCHLSASGGFLAGKQFDMVRIGILLYGYKPFKSNKISVRPVMRVYAPILRTRKLSAGEGVLYGDFKLKGASVVGLVRFGYADGLERRCVGGQVNDRCMDVTAIADSRKKRKVVIMDNAQTLSQKYQTIPYEILTKVSVRAEKIYIR